MERKPAGSRQARARAVPLRRLARVWRERRTGLVKAPSGLISIVEGELTRGSDRAALLEALSGEKLLFREQAVDGVPVPIVGALLLDQARRIADPDRLPEALSFQDTDRLDLPPAIADFIFSGERVADLIRRPAQEREALRRDLAALWLLGFADEDAVDERKERRWLKAQLLRLRTATTPRSIVGVGEHTPQDVALRSGQQMLDRATALQASTHPKVREAASGVSAQLLLAIRQLR